MIISGEIMKKIILFLTTLMVVGCQTTFEQRQHVYVAVYKEARRIVQKFGPTAAHMYLDKKVTLGEITDQERQELLTIVNAHETK